MFGLALLIASSKLLVYGAENIAISMGLSRHVIGLTILAVGTSLPELAASLAAAMKREFDILDRQHHRLRTSSTTLAVIGIAGVLGPGGIPETALTRDFLVMVVLTLIFFAIAYGFGDQGQIGRFEGGVLLISFCAYYVLIYLTSGEPSPAVRVIRGQERAMLAAMRRRDKARRILEILDRRHPSPKVPPRSWRPLHSSRGRPPVRANDR